MRKNVLSLLLALALLLTATGAFAAEDLTTWAMDEPVKATVMYRQNMNVVSYAPGESETNNIYYNAYKDDLGIELEYVIRAFDDEYTQKLTMAMASDDLPDIMVLPVEQYTQLARAGKLWDMQPVFDEYASELTKKNMTSDGGVILEAATVDGTLFGIPMGDSQRVPTNFLWLRQDWLEKLNLDVPQSFDDVIAIARAFKTQDPDGNGQDDTWGLGICNKMAEVSGYGSIEGVANAFGGSILDMIWVLDDNGAPAYMATSEGTRKGLETLAEMFQEGLINEEFGVTGEDGVGEAVAAGKCGLFYAGDGISWGYGRDAIANNPDVAWVCVKAPSAEGDVADTYSFMNFQYVYAVNSSFEHPEALIKMINFNNDRINSPDATLESLAQWGVNPETGINQCDYTLGLIDPYLNKALGYNTSITQVYNGEIAEEDLMPEAYRYWEGIKRFIDGGHEETMRADPDDLTAFQYYMCWGPINGSWTKYQELRDADKIIMSIYYDSPTPTMVKRWATLKALQEETFVKIISGSESIEAFDAFVEQWKSLGGDTITAEIAERFVK